MPLEILGPLVLCGLALAVILVWLLVNHPARLLTDREVAEISLLADYPRAVTSGDWLIGDDGRIAVCQMAEPEGAIALVEVLGSKHVTRQLFADDLRQVTESGEGVRVELRDFTLPTVEIRLKDESKRRKILGLLDGAKPVRCLSDEELPVRKPRVT